MNINRLADASAQIKQQRKSLQMTQRDLSSKTGISPRSLSAIENGGDMQLSTLLKICAALKLSITVSADDTTTKASIW